MRPPPPIEGISALGRHDTSPDEREQSQENASPFVRPDRRRR
jgi:hypothetical protein